MNRTTASHCSDLGGAGFEICAALCSPEGLSLDEGQRQNSALVGIMYNFENEKSELELDVSIQLVCLLLF